ncbi:MAG: BatA domain-containing protein, partial [Acidobacteria bacterium]|nr:BatA domain-containing protein [Acidobacteriota bacterium]
MFGLSFLSPLFLAGAAAVAVPIAIHLFYRKAEPVIAFAAMRYLRQAPVEQSRRRRLRELVLLALRAAALLLLALAFAQAADVVAPLSRDRAGALAAVAGLTPGAGSTRYRAALQRAADESGGRSGRIVVVTDLQQSGWDAAGAGLPDNVAVDIEDVDGPTANLAVTSLRVEGAEAVASVQYFSPRSATEQVVFTVDQRRAGAVPVTLAPGANGEARLPLQGADTGTLAAAITDREGYQADNVRYAVLDPASTISVLTLTASGHPSESLYLERALAVADGVRGFRFHAIGGAALAGLDPQALDRTDVVVVLGTRGLEQRGRERLLQFVRAGGGLLLTAGSHVEPAIVKQALGGAIATSWRLRGPVTLSLAPDDARHPVFRPFGGVGALGNVTFTGAALVDAPAAAKVVARFTDGTPALVEEKTGAGRVLVFGSDLNYEGNDFPLQPAFLPFVHESLRYLAAPRAARSEYVVGELAGASGMTPGVVRVGAGGRQVAVNTDPREADPRRMTADAFRSGISRLQAAGAQQARAEVRQQEDRQALWRYGLLLMVVGLAAEGLLGRRLG